MSPGSPLAHSERKLHALSHPFNFVFFWSYCPSSSAQAPDLWAPHLFAQFSLNARLSFLPLAGHTSSAPSDPSTCPQKQSGQQMQRLIVLARTGFNFNENP